MIIVKGDVMRNTKQKHLILEIVNSSNNHLNASEIYIEAKKTIPNISLGTIYRVLNDLVTRKMILRIKTNAGIDCFDSLERKPHQHFICNNCGEIHDIYNVRYEKDTKELKDYKIDRVDITFTGLCNNCQKERM